ncbi:hypothetical protein P4O66_022222, partial [Electrophorus voltai]
MYVDVVGMAAELQQQYRMDCGQRNRTAFRIQVEKVHGVICSESGLSALEEKHLAKRARHSQEDDSLEADFPLCSYYVQEMFDPVRVTHFSEGSSILEDTTDSDGDISEREGCYCATAQEKGPTNGSTRSGPWVPQNSTTIVCVGYVSSPCAAWHGEVYTPASLGALQLDSINQSSSVAIHHRPPNHRPTLHSNTPAELSWSNSTGNCYWSHCKCHCCAPAHSRRICCFICHTNISLFLAATCSVIFGGEGLVGLGQFK